MTNQSISRSTGGEGRDKEIIWGKRSSEKGEEGGISTGEAFDLPERRVLGMRRNQKLGSHGVSNKIKQVGHCLVLG